MEMCIEDKERYRKIIKYKKRVIKLKDTEIEMRRKLSNICQIEIELLTKINDLTKELTATNV